jgi:glycosyltransferase involved in cell wall biosynthesis
VPRVSVVIPNYNHARYLPARIDSVLNQTFQDFDLLILDDASRDDSTGVITPYVGGRVRFLPNSRNSGSTFAQWNKGIAETTGDYLWIAESDDEADPRFLERMVSLLEKHPSTSFAFCQATLINERSIPFGLALPLTTAAGGPSRYTQDFVEPGSAELKRYLQWQRAPVPNASSVVFRRRSLEVTGSADPSYRVCGDFHLYARLLLNGDVAYVADPLNRYRHHGASVRSTTARDATDVWERYRMARELFPMVNPERVEALEAQRKLASYWLIAAIQNRRTTPLSRHRQIWRDARQVDAHIGRHLVSALGQHLWNSLRRRTAPGTP